MSKTNQLTTLAWTSSQRGGKLQCSRLNKFRKKARDAAAGGAENKMMLTRGPWVGIGVKIVDQIAATEGVIGAMIEGVIGVTEEGTGMVIGAGIEDEAREAVDSKTEVATETTFKGMS